MNTKGFTLIEITAVVLILGVIFLMSYPTLENILKKSEKDQADLDNENIIMAAKTYINLHNDEYEFTEGNKLEIYLNDLVNENLLENNDYSSNDIVSCKIVSNKLDCKVEKIKIYNNGTAIYFNPETASVCTKEEADINVNDNGTPTGVKTGCMKWYAFNDSDGKTTLNMILDHNTTPLVPFNSNNLNTEMLEAKEALESDVSTWNEDIKNKARLIGAQEIAQITGNEDFDVDVANSNNGWFYFDTNTDSLDETINAAGLSKYAWLFDNLCNCIRRGCNVQDNNKYNKYNSTDSSTLSGFWTLTPITGTINNLWYVDQNGYMRNIVVSNSAAGLRPVITIDKSLIS